MEIDKVERCSFLKDFFIQGHSRISVRKLHKAIIIFSSENPIIMPK